MKSSAWTDVITQWWKDGWEREWVRQLMREEEVEEEKMYDLMWMYFG